MWRCHAYRHCFLCRAFLMCIDRMLVALLGLLTGLNIMQKKFPRVVSWGYNLLWNFLWKRKNYSYHINTEKWSTGVPFCSSPFHFPFFFTPILISLATAIITGIGQPARQTTKQEWKMKCIARKYNPRCSWLGSVLSEGPMCYSPTDVTVLTCCISISFSLLVSLLLGILCSYAIMNLLGRSIQVQSSCQT